MARENLPRVDIDLALAVLCAVARPGETLEISEIAEVCGCHASTIGLNFKSAKAKLRDSVKLQQIASDYDLLPKQS